MHVSRVFALPLVAVAMLPLDTRAAASLMVDDASITDAGRCQLESWGRHTDVGNDWTAVPACTFADTEWSLGVSHQHATSTTQWAVGAKRYCVIWISAAGAWRSVPASAATGTARAPTTGASMHR